MKKRSVPPWAISVAGSFITTATAVTINLATGPYPNWISWTFVIAFTLLGAVPGVVAHSRKHKSSTETESASPASEFKISYYMETTQEMMSIDISTPSPEVAEKWTRDIEEIRRGRSTDA